MAVRTDNSAKSDDLGSLNMPLDIQGYSTQELERRGRILKLGYVKGLPRFDGRMFLLKMPMVR